MLTVIRIEHPEDGCGIFRDRYEKELSYKDIMSTFSYDSENIGNIENKHYKMKSARSIKGFTPDHFCAYPSLTIMRKFINQKEIKKLLNLGFQILLLDVKKHIADTNQILYKKQHVSKTKNISSLFL